MFNAGLAASILREAAAAVTFPPGQVLATDTPGALSLAIRQRRGGSSRLRPLERSPDIRTSFGGRIP
jgi:hypothetical protein